MTVCLPFQVLEISDGTTTVNLLSPKSGFCLLSWSPAIAEPKGGGVWKDSQLAAGRQLAMRKLANVADAFVLAVRNHWPDDLIRDTQNLRRLLEKACAYRTSKWQDEEVWIKRQGVYEAYPTYTLIEDYRTPQDGNPHGSSHFWTAMGNSAFPEFKLIVEHEPWWRGDVPGTGTCVQTSGQQEWGYGDYWQINTNTIGAGDECRDIYEASDGSMYAGEDGEVWRSVNGTAWVAAAAKPVGMEVYAMTEHSTYIYAAGYDTGGANPEIWRTTTGLNNWANVSVTLGTNYPNTLVTHTDGYMYLATGTAGPGGADGVYRSNNGTVWNQVLDSPDCLCILSASDGYIYAGGSDYLWRSANGTTWSLVYDAQAGGSFNWYCLYEASDGYFYAGIAWGGAGYIYRSADGLNWQQTAGHWGAIVYVYAFGESPGGILYAVGTGGRIWESLDGINWTLRWILAATADFWTIIRWSGNGCFYLGEQVNIWWRCFTTTTCTQGRAATCLDEIYVANKQNIANLTCILRFTAGVGYSANLFPSVPPAMNLLPAAPANGDAVLFGIEPGVVNGGPFCSLVFDIGTPYSDTLNPTLVWQYSTGAGAWTTLNVTDHTSDFGIAGVNSVHWVPPTAPAWTSETYSTCTAYWVRLLVNYVPVAPVTPTQQNRDVYTIVWPRVDIDEAQVLGDLPALMQFKFHNQSDEDGYTAFIDELDLLDNRMIVGLRSISRGADFTAFLNCADEQNPVGVIVNVGTNSAFGNDITAPTGRIVVHTTDGASTWADECIFTLASSIAQNFYGDFHAYARAQEVDWDAAIDEVRIRLQVRTGSGGVTFTTDHKSFRNLNDWQLLDFKGLSIPASSLLSSSDLGDETEIAIQVWSSASTLTVNFYDLILIPTDEWALDAVDKAVEDDSGVANGYLLDVDSVTYPKRDIRALVRTADTEGLVRSVYQPNTPGHAMLQANADQRLWFLTARGCVTGTHTGANNQPVLTDAAASFLTSGVEAGQYIYNLDDSTWGIITAVTATTVTATTLAGGAFDWDTGEEYLIICPNWRSEPWNCHSVQMWNNARYLSMRGAR